MSDNLELSQVAAAQNQKEVTINDQAGQLDAGLTDKVDVALTGTTSPLVLSDAQALRCMVLKLTGTHPGGAYEVHCPTNRKVYVLWNGTADNVTFKTAAGTGIAVNAGAVLILYCDGTNVIQLAGLIATIDDIGDVVIAAAHRDRDHDHELHLYLGHAVGRFRRRADRAELRRLPDQRAGRAWLRGRGDSRGMSNNLALSQVAAAQNQKEVTINDQAGQLDAGLTEKVEVALTGTTSPLALSDAQALRCMVLKLTGTHPGGAYEVHCPTNKKVYVVWNSTAGDVTFKTVAGTGIPVGAGAILILYCDGTDVIQLAGLVATINDIGDVVITTAASGQMLRFNGSSWVNEDSPYDVGMFIPGTHGDGALMAQVVLTRAVSFADDFAGARAHAGVTATAETVLDVHRNGAPIGTITFGTGASAGTFATAGGGAETFAAGDRLAIINEDPADATLADLSITFLGKRT